MTLTLSTKALVIAVAWLAIAAMLAVHGLIVATIQGLENDNPGPGCFFMFAILIAPTVTACAVFMM